MAPEKVVELFSVDHNNWFSHCKSHDLGKDNEFCWFLWTRRNRGLFVQNYSPPNRLSDVCKFVEQLERVSNPLGRDASRSHIIEVRWKSPPEGWVKLNSDGSSKGMRMGTGLLDLFACLCTPFIAELRKA